MLKHVSDYVDSIILSILSCGFILLCLVLVRPLTSMAVLFMAWLPLALLVTRMRRAPQVEQQHPIVHEPFDRSEIVAETAELRRLLDETRTNVGMIADAVYRLRLDGEARTVSVDGIWECLDVQGRRIDEQSTNLGLVAGGMNDLRNANPRSELVEERYAALVDSIVKIAAQVDMLGKRMSDRKPRRLDAELQSEAIQTA